MLNIIISFTVGLLVGLAGGWFVVKNNKAKILKSFDRFDRTKNAYDKIREDMIKQKSKEKKDA